ncbi:MAG: glycosyl transferase [Gemmatimonadota bacterium]|jgi:glucosyl-3-phosphoglycerate synthase
MSDFFQNGVITTLQSLGDRPVDELEAELLAVTERQKIALILPALYSEFDGPAMPGIVEQLKGAEYVDRIVLSLDRAHESEFARVKDIMGELPQKVDVIWNDGPRVGNLLAELVDSNFDAAEQGKGRGVWLSLGYALTYKDTRTFALHDCDIVNYDREMLTRLVYPIAHPGTDFEYAKGYYARASDRLHGRVTRLFFTPLVRALNQICGPLQFFNYLDSFRYALAGEFAMVRSLATGIRISPTWGLEISLLGEVFEKTTVQRVCQVEIADSYEHKHQSLVAGKTNEGLGRMAFEIAATLFGAVAQGGVVLAPSTFGTLLANYMRHARLAIDQYSSLALLNGLEYDRHLEIDAVETFSESLRAAQQRFLEDPIGIPMLGAWARVRAAIPGFDGRLREAVEADNQRAAAVSVG